MSYSTELIKGTLRTIVLKLLADNKRMYGYEITQRVKELSDEKISITEGALYPILHALEKEELVTVESEFTGKRVRKYYRLNSAGRSVSKQKVTEFAEFIKTMKFLLETKPRTS